MTRHCASTSIIGSSMRNETRLVPDSKMNECVDPLGEDTFLATLDADCGYSHAQIDEIVCDKTAFTSHLGSCRFNCMPVGLETALALTCAQ